MVSLPRLTQTILRVCASVGDCRVATRAMPTSKPVITNKMEDAVPLPKQAFCVHVSVFLYLFIGALFHHPLVSALHPGLNPGLSKPSDLARASFGTEAVVYSKVKLCKKRLYSPQSSLSTARRMVITNICPSRVKWKWSLAKTCRPRGERVWIATVPAMITSGWG